jgi:ubiquitin carboxyl-terminal hydrolase 25
LAYTDERQVNDSPSSKETARRAVEVIAEHRNSDALRSWLACGELRGLDNDITEAYRILNIQDRTAQIDFDLLRQTLDFIDGDREAKEKALKVLEMARDPEKAHQPPQNWPVGLQNIGNTCYLNSLLQFFFTIKPLRELVLEFEESETSFNDAQFQEQYVSNRKVTVDEIRRAQDFVLELKKLFKSMIEATERDVRPEVQLAVLAFQASKTISPSVAAQDGEREMIGGLPVAGPLLPPSKDIVMAGTEDENASEQTLVDDAQTSTTKADSPQSLDNAAEQTNNGNPKPPTRKAPPPPLPERPKTVPHSVELEARQQDASEVMDHMLFLLLCAVTPGDLGRQAPRSHLIRDMFHGGELQTLETLQPDGTLKLERKTLPSLNIFVEVLEREKDIYLALNGYFAWSNVSEDNIPGSEGWVVILPFSIAFIY